MKYRLCSWSVILCAVASTFLSTSVFGQSRDAAECYNEQATKEALMAEFSSVQFASGGPPPGGLIMTGPFGDPLYSDPAWEKREYSMIFRSVVPGTMAGPRYVDRMRVEMHYMFNRNTRQVAQVKYKSTPQQGCVGTRELADAMDATHGGTPGEAVPLGFVPGMVISHLNVAFFSPIRWDASHWVQPSGGGACPQAGCPILQRVPQAQLK